MVEYIQIKRTTNQTNTIQYNTIQKTKNKKQKNKKNKNNILYLNFSNYYHGYFNHPIYCRGYHRD